MSIVGYGLFAVAISILVSTWIIHRDIVKVYYPQYKLHKDGSRRVVVPSSVGDPTQAIYGFAFDEKPAASLEESEVQWEELEDRLDMEENMK